MHGTLDWIKVYSRKLWVRMILIGLLSVVSVGGIKLVDGVLPDSLTETFRAQGVNRLLDIIASSMLAVTTFSVTIMVTVQFSAAQNWTPRAHLVILQDKATQTVLATFLGAYIYALLGIVLLETPYFGEHEVVALYLTTIVVLAVIVLTLGRWILRLQTFGSLIDTARRMEEQTRAEFDELSCSMCRWAHEFDGTPPENAWPVASKKAGYIQSIDLRGLQNGAEKLGIEVWLTQPTGRFVASGAPLAHVTGADIDATEIADARRRKIESDIRAEIGVGDVRSIGKDPRFGLIQLSEIGSKALSPGINDPGTAIDVLTRLTRILGGYTPEATEPEPLQYDRLHLAALSPDDLMEDAFSAITRDIAGQIQVYLMLFKSLEALYLYGPDHLRAAALRRARFCYGRACEDLRFADDIDRLVGAVPVAFRVGVDMPEVME